MNVVIYTKSGCPNCVTAKRLLDSNGLAYEELNTEAIPATLELLRRDFPELRQMPQIFINGQRVGGLAGLQAALKDNNK